MSKLTAVLAISLIVPAALACSDGSSAATAAPPSDTTSTVVYNIALDTTIIDSANVVVGSTIPIHVVVTRSGSPVVDGSVTWTVGSGHGVLSSPTSTTDSLGFASVSWTVGDTVGLNSLTAVIGSASVTVRAAGIAGLATALTRVSDDSVWLVSGASTLLTTRAVDRFGNAVAGAHITWTTTSGVLATMESITGALGNAQIAFTAPMTSSVSTVTATLDGKASIRFRVVTTSSDANAGRVGSLSNDDLEHAGRQIR